MFRGRSFTGKSLSG